MANHLRPASLLALLPLTAANATPDTTLWFDKPATTFHSSLPIGNGRIGAMVFGGIDSERIVLNTTTATGNEDLLMTGTLNDGHGGKGVTYATRLRAITRGGTVRTEGDQLHVENADEATLLLTAAATLQRTGGRQTQVRYRNQVTPVTLKPGERFSLKSSRKVPKSGRDSTGRSLPIFPLKPRSTIFYRRLLVFELTNRHFLPRPIQNHQSPPLAAPRDRR